MITTTESRGLFEELKLKVESKILETLILAQEIYNREFEIPAIGYRDIGRVAGLAWLRENRVEFSKTLLLENADKFIARTVPHEIAHLICFKLYPGASGHGREWKSIMSRLGLEPSRCHSYDTSSVSNTRPRPFVYVCRCVGHEFKLTRNIHNKILLGQVRTCCKCHTKIVWKKLI